jgi:hypothetical protein
MVGANRCRDDQMSFEPLMDPGRETDPGVWAGWAALNIVFGG